MKRCDYCTKRDANLCEGTLQDRIDNKCDLKESKWRITTKSEQTKEIFKSKKEINMRER